MNCPKCKVPAQELMEEVDIGVGIQRFRLGVECDHCGIIGVCPCCGAWDFEICAPWCSTVRGLNE